MLTFVLDQMDRLPTLAWAVAVMASAWLMILAAVVPMVVVIELLAGAR